MALIEMSSGFASGLPARMCGVGNNIESASVLPGSQMGLLNGLDYNKARIHLMKGAVPTDLSGLFNTSARSADRLVTFSVGHPTVNDFTPTVANTNPIVITTNYKVADLSGTVSWWHWQVPVTTYEDSVSTGVRHQITGSVSLVGGTGDLEMDSLSIVAGQSYRILNLRMQFPTSWIY